MQEADVSSHFASLAVEFASSFSHMPTWRGTRARTISRFWLFSSVNVLMWISYFERGSRSSCKIAEKVEISWCWQHPSIAYPEWRRANHNLAHTDLQQNMADWRMIYLMDKVTSDSAPKKGNLQQCQNYRTISLISHPKKVMLRIILNRIKPQAGNIIAEEHAGFRTGRSTTEQSSTWEFFVRNIFNINKISTMYSLDFKKAFDWVWLAAMWQP